MNEYSLTAPVEKTRPRFWRRQFGATVTRNQVVFGVVFGTLSPVACFVFDPIVFQSKFVPDGGLLRGYSLLVYLGSAVAIGVLAWWLMFGKRIVAWAGVAGGVLLAGASLSFLIGCVLLPFSLLGLLLIIGVFGFVPFFTAFVYWRNGIRCVRQAREYARRQKLVGFAVMGAALVIGIPAAAQWQVNRLISGSVEQIIQRGSPPSSATVQSLKYLNWCLDTNDFVRAYKGETDATRKDWLSATYKEITGESIEWRLAIMND